MAEITPHAIKNTEAEKHNEEPQQRPSLAERELMVRTRWLINSRRLAALGVLVVPLVARYAFGVGFPVVPVIIVSITIAAYNTTPVPKSS